MSKQILVGVIASLLVSCSTGSIGENPSAEVTMADNAEAESSGAGIPVAVPCYSKDPSDNPRAMCVCDVATHTQCVEHDHDCSCVLGADASIAKGNCIAVKDGDSCAIYGNVFCYGEAPNECHSEHKNVACIAWASGFDAGHPHPPCWGNHFGPVMSSAPETK